MTVRLEVPQMYPLMNSNHRPHPMVRARQTRQWRELGCVRAQAVRLQPITGRVRIVVTIHTATARTYDAGNYYPTAKALIDGLRDAGVLVDDSNEYVEGPDMRPGLKSNPPKLVLELIPTGA